MWAICVVCACCTALGNICFLSLSIESFVLKSDSFQFMDSTVKPVCREFKCSEAVNEVIQWHMSIDRGSPMESYLSPRKPMNHSLLVVRRMVNVWLIECYCPVASQWKVLKEVSTDLDLQSVAIFQNRLYLFSEKRGKVRKNCFSYLDLETKNVVDLPCPKSIRLNHGAAVLNGCLYIAGGISSYNRVLNTVEELDITLGGTWRQVASMRVPRSEPGLVPLSNNLYAVGGLNENQDILTSVECYEEDMNEWTTLAPMIEKRQNFSIYAYDGHIWVAGGHVNLVFKKTVERYDPRDNSWSKASETSNIPSSNSFRHPTHSIHIPFSDAVHSLQMSTISPMRF